MQVASPAVQGLASWELQGMKLTEGFGFGGRQKPLIPVQAFSHVQDAFHVGIRLNLGADQDPIEPPENLKPVIQRDAAYSRRLRPSDPQTLNPKP